MLVPENEFKNFIERIKRLVGSVKTKDMLSVTGPSGLRMGMTTIVATTVKYTMVTKYGNQ